MHCSLFSDIAMRIIIHSSTRRALPRQSHRLPFLALAVCTATSILVVYPVSSGTDMPVSLAKLERVLGIIQTSYVDRVSLDKLTDGAIEGIMDQLDPYSYYETKSTHSGSVAARDAKQKLSTGMQAWWNDGTLEVWSVEPYGTAGHAGLLPGDEIRTLNGRPAAEYVDEEVDELLNPPNLSADAAAATVTLSIKRHHEKLEKTFTLHYDSWKASTPAIGCVIDDSIGCIRFDDFHLGTSYEVEYLLKQYKDWGIKKFVLDLRLNNGGYLGAAFLLADELVGRKEMTIQVIPNTDRAYQSSHEDILNGASLIVLVGPQSASAAEIFAGILQDEDRAVIVGLPTYGKSLVMRDEALSDGSSMMLITGRCYLPSGRFLQRSYRARSYTAEGVPFRTELDNMNHSHDREFVPSDSVYHTLHGRSVYGRQGVIPDIIIPEMPTLALGSETTSNNIFYQCAEQIIKERGEEIAKQYSPETIYSLPLSNESLMKFLRIAAKHHNTLFDDSKVSKDLTRIRSVVLTKIARRFFERFEWRARLLESDHTFTLAKKHFDEAKAFALAMNR